MSWGTGNVAGGAWTAAEIEDMTDRLLGTLQLLKHGVASEYPPIPRFPEWEKAVADGIVW